MIPPIPVKPSAEIQMSDPSALSTPKTPLSRSDGDASLLDRGERRDVREAMN